MSLELSFSEDYASLFQQRIRAFREKLDLESNSQVRGEDRISALPNTVLSHILSFIPSTKEHVRTSVLSTRWKDVWASVPNLYFNDDEFSSSAVFVAFVDRVLLARESVDIQKLCLHFNSCHAEDYPHIDDWINTAVERNVVELDLSVDFERERGVMGENYESFNEEDEILYEEDEILHEEDEMYVLPPSVLTCKTLKVLSLRATVIINIPTSVYCCFPVLELFYLHFEANRHVNVTMDLFGFPALKVLTMDGDFGYNGLNFSISAPELKTLKIDMYSPYNDGHCLYKFFIDAPKLEKLNLRQCCLSNFIFKNTDSPVEASIALYKYRNEDYWTEDCINRATEFLAQISRVKYLSFKMSIHQACSIPAFENLRKLTFTHFMKSCLSKTLMKLLERSPNLEQLEIDDGFYPPRRVMELEAMEAESRRLKNKAEKVRGPMEGELVIDFAARARILNWVPPESVPNCLLTHLKTVLFKGFMGKRHIGYLDDIELSKYLLKNGQAMEEMIIYTPGLEKGTEEHINEEITMCVWGSKTVQVEVIEKMFYFEDDVRLFSK